MCFSTGEKNEAEQSIQGNGEVISIMASDESSPGKGGEELEPFCAGKLAPCSILWGVNNRHHHNSH